MYNQELLKTLYNPKGPAFVLGTLISMGLSLTIAQITGPLRNARFFIMALLANFVVSSIAAYILIRVFSLDELLAVGLLLISLATSAPGLPKLVAFAKLVIYVQHDEPTNPRKRQNQLPARKEGFRFGAHFFDPYIPLFDGSYNMPQPVVVE